MKKRKMFLRMITASLMRRRSRMLVAFLAIAIGATILSGLMTIYFDVPRQMGAQFRNYGANMIFTPTGEDFTNEEMRTDFQTHWAVTCPAVLKVKKPGGLAQGYHDLKYGFCFTSSYMPPVIQDHLDPDQESMVFMPEFGHHVNERRLLIV